LKTRIDALKIDISGKGGSTLDWGAIIWMILSILGAALIAGGIVAYRRSRRTGVRAFGAAAFAAGVVMWAIVLVTIPVSST